jgi:hypothetical protein
MSLAGHCGRLPDSVIITEKIEVSEKILASGGFGDVRCGRYIGHLVAVKTLRVAAQDNLLRIREVSQQCFPGHLGCDLDHSSPAILQRSRPLEHAIPPERLETCWGSRGHGKGTIYHCVRVDGAWEYH